MARAEHAALANVAESAAIAAEEAVASVARVCTETLTDDASAPDARSNAAMALSSSALLDFLKGILSSRARRKSRGRDDAGDGPTGNAESATDATRDAPTRGAMDGAERGAFMAYAAAVSRCHAADRPPATVRGIFIRSVRSVPEGPREDRAGAVASRARRRRRWACSAGPGTRRGDAGEPGREDGNARRVPAFVAAGESSSASGVGRSR